MYMKAVYGSIQEKKQNAPPDGFMCYSFCWDFLLHNGEVNAEIDKGFSSPYTLYHSKIIVFGKIKKGLHQCMIYTYPLCVTTLEILMLFYSLNIFMRTCYTVINFYFTFHLDLSSN